MSKSFKVVVVGAGFGGLCMGIKLRAAGITDFVILEKAEDLGGTWRENTYPGAECDIPSALYSYSFEHNADWEFKWSGQKQILKYQHDTADKYGLHKHLRFNQAVVNATFDQDTKKWNLQTSNGEELITQHFVTALGQLHHPNTPEITGADSFKGDTFHSAKWDHTVDLEGKRVGVIGNAASAVQFIPEIAKLAGQINIFQRSPNWILPKFDRRYSEWEQRISAKIPMFTKMYRWYIWAVGEYGILSAIRGNPLARWKLKRDCLKNLDEQIKDPELKQKLIPDYPVGAKRILFCDHYYPALMQNNVELLTTSIDSIDEAGIVLADGSKHELDVIVYSTGFKTNPFLASIDIQGLQGKSIREAWSEGAQAYLGVSTHGFPNLHMMYGPNTNLGHSSIIIMLEAQANFVVKAIQHQDNNELAALDVKSDVEAQFNQEVQTRLSDLAFSKVAQSWYMDGNKVTNNWVGGTKEYVRRLSTLSWDAYDALS